MMLNFFDKDHWEETMWKLLIWCFILFMAALLITGFVTAYPTYYNVELEELLDRTLETLEKQDRELTRAGNELKLQMAYTERLKIILEVNDIEYERYPDFLDNRIFRAGQLTDAEYLYTNTLDLEYLLMLATNLGGLIDGEEIYITPSIPFED